MLAKFGLVCLYSRKKRGPKAYVKVRSHGLTSRASAAPQPSLRHRGSSLVNARIRSSASPDISPRTDGRLVPQMLDVTQYLDPTQHDDQLPTAHSDPSPDQRPNTRNTPVPRIEDDPGESDGGVICKEKC